MLSPLPRLQTAVSPCRYLERGRPTPLRSCASLAALLLLCAATAFGESYEWVRSGARTENPVILSLLLASDLDTGQAVVRALSRRADGYVEDIIEGLLNQHSPRAALLLETYLSAVTAAEDSGGRWARANPRALPGLLEALPKLRDAHARAAVLRLLPHAEPGLARPQLAAELEALAESLGTRRWRAGGGSRRELFAALAAAEIVGGEELAPALVDIARLSRDGEAVREARRVAERLIRDDFAQ